MWDRFWREGWLNLRQRHLPRHFLRHPEMPQLDVACRHFPWHFLRHFLRHPQMPQLDVGSRHFTRHFLRHPEMSRLMPHRPLHSVCRELSMLVPRCAAKCQCLCHRVNLCQCMCHCMPPPREVRMLVPRFGGLVIRDVAADVAVSRRCAYATV